MYGPYSTLLIELEAEDEGDIYVEKINVKVKASRT